MSLLLLLDTGTAGYVVSFPTVAPRARFDDTPWTIVTIDESATQVGPWTQVVQSALDPVDEDPGNPTERDITLRGAQLASGWYRITFKDAQGNSSPVPVVYNGDSWAPGVRDVANLMTSRLGDADDNPQGTFTATTTPTDTQVRAIIDSVQKEVLVRLRGKHPGQYADLAREVVAIGAVAYIEQGARPEGGLDGLAPTSRTIFLGRLNDLATLCNNDFVFLA